jgi:hypothetical protein
MKLVQEAYPAPPLSDIVVVIQKCFPVRKSMEIFELIQALYPTYGVKEFFKETQKLFGELGGMQVVELIRRSFPRIHVKLFPESVKRGATLDVPDGIIAHLTRKCRGNVHDNKVVEATSSEPFDDGPSSAARNLAAMGDKTLFNSAFRQRADDIAHTRNNWVCYDFKQTTIVPSHYAIRTNGNGPGHAHMKSWLIETSADGENWLEIDQRGNTADLNGESLTGTFAVAHCDVCRFIRLVNIGRNHYGDDCLCISAWEIFGAILE